MGIVERRQRQKEEVRKEIMYAAWDLVQKEGWQALSIRKIAEAIEYSVPVIYDHFENKEAILLEFSRKGFWKLTNKMVEAKALHTEPADQIKAMADAYWEFATGNIEFYKLMFGVGMAYCEIAKAMPEQESFREQVIEPIEVLLKKNGKKQVDSCLKYHTFWSIIHGLISIKMIGNPANEDELNKLVLDDAIGGFIKNLQ